MCRFPSFHETATADAVLGYLIAFLVLLATIKLWHLMRLNPKLHMITATLQRAWADISGFLVVITIMFLAYSIAVRAYGNASQRVSRQNHAQCVDVWMRGGSSSGGKSCCLATGRLLVRYPEQDT